MILEGKLYFKNTGGSYPTPYINIKADEKTKRALRELHKKRIKLKIIGVVDEKFKRFKLVIEED